MFAWINMLLHIAIVYASFIVGFWAFLDYLHTGDTISFWAVIGSSAIAIGVIVTIDEWLKS